MSRILTKEPRTYVGLFLGTINQIVTLDSRFICIPCLMMLVVLVRLSGTLLLGGFLVVAAHCVG